MLTLPADFTRNRPSTGPGRPTPDRRTVTAMTGEVLLGGIVAIGVSLLAQWFMTFAPPASESAVPFALAVLGASVLSGVTVVLLVRSGPWPRWGTAASWVVLAGISTGAQAAMLSGTRYYLGGITADQSFRTEYLTRLTSSPRLADIAYADLPPFYPAGWFWVGGRFANLAGMPGWEAMKPYSILTFAVVAVVPFALWSRIVSRRMALVLSLATALIGLADSAIEPYSWPASATIPPLAVLAWRWLAQLRATGSIGGFRTVALMGLGLGVFGMTYTLLFGFFAVVLGVFACVAIGLTWRAASARAEVADGSEVAEVVSAGRVARGALIAAAGAGAIAMLIMLPAWGPYLFKAADGDHGENVAAHYLPKLGAFLPLPMTQFSVTGTLCMAGLVWLMVRLRNQIAQALLMLVALGYGWYLLSTLMLPAETTLLPFRMFPMLLVALACAGLLGFRDLLMMAPAHMRPAARRVLMAVGVVGLLTLSQASMKTFEDEVNWAFQDYYPTGQNALGERDPAEPGAWVPELNGTVAELTGRSPAENVVLTDCWPLMDTEPYWGFQAQTPHYANPAGDFTARNALILRWSRQTTPTGLAAELDRSPYRPPNVFVLTRKADGLHLKITSNVFPRKKNVRIDEVVFEPKMFKGPMFERRDVGPYAVIVRK